jgi:hypothetical protein
MQNINIHCFCFFVIAVIFNEFPEAENEQCIKFKICCFTISTPSVFIIAVHIYLFDILSVSDTVVF